MLKAHNWHWVSSIGTNVKINIFETRPVTSGRSFISVPFSQQCTVLHFRTFHEFISLLRFGNNSCFHNTSGLKIHQQFKSEHNYWISGYCEIILHRNETIWNNISHATIQLIYLFTYISICLSFVINWFPPYTHKMITYACI